MKWGVDYIMVLFILGFLLLVHELVWMVPAFTWDINDRAGTCHYFRPYKKRKGWGSEPLLTTMHNYCRFGDKIHQYKVNNFDNWRFDFRIIKSSARMCRVFRIRNIAHKTYKPLGKVKELSCYITDGYDDLKLDVYGKI